MREKYETLSLKDLREIVKGLGIKGTSTMKKSDLVDILAEKEEMEAEEKKTSEKIAPKAEKKISEEVPAEVKDEISKPKIRKKIITVKNSEAKEKNTVDFSEAFSGIENDTSAQKDTEVTDSPFIPAAQTEETASPAAGDNSHLEEKTSKEERKNSAENPPQDNVIPARGILEVIPDGFGFIRCENFLPGENDVYVSPNQIRRFGLQTGDILEGNAKIKTSSEKFSPLIFIKSVNGFSPEDAAKRPNFEDMTPIFPNEKIKLDIPGAPVSMRIMDLISPVGKGQRGMIVSPPKAGKTTLLKDVAKCVKYSNPDMHMIILLIDERPEEVTDIKETIQGDNVEVIYSTFDETPEHHKRVAEMVIERAKRLVEHHCDVIILLDSITRMTRAYNQVIQPSGRTLSGGLDPAALHMPKRFFGAARNMREGGSLTILATALVDTGSKMDDVVYEEFKGTGNMEMVLDRKLSERRVFPAIDIPKSGTRREDLLLNRDEMEAINNMRKAFNGMKPDEAVDKVIDLFQRTRSNREFVERMRMIRLI